MMKEAVKFLVDLIQERRFEVRPGYNAEVMVGPGDFKVHRVGWVPPRPTGPVAQDTLLSVESVVDWCERRGDGVRVWVGSGGVVAEAWGAVPAAVPWYRDRGSMALTGSASFREWMRAVEGGWMTHATFVGLLDRHRPEFEREGGDGIVAALRSLDFKKDASHASVLTEAGYYEMVGTAKGVTMKTKFPARLKVEVKPWVGVEERVGLEFAVGFDPESVQWKLTAVTDVEEALVQGRTRLRETLQKALPGAVCFDGAPGWAEIP